ncbi:MAG: helix-turn-helix transcriptional regulator [Lachnospiraceae bacterium]|nr:helix-turn-helix transcriptional regulator [Lachnospiraceae bacterium]
MYFILDSRSIPKVRLVDETIIEPPYVHRRRIPHEWIIYLIKNGVMELEEDGISYHLVPGDFLLLSPDGQHEGRKATYCEYFYIHFQHANIRMAEADEQQLRERMYSVRSEALRSSSGYQTYPYGEETEWDLLLPKYCHMTDEAAVSLTRSLHDMELNDRDHMEYYKTLCGCQLLQLLVQVSRYCLSDELESAGMLSARSYQKVLEVQNYLHTSYQEQITGDLLASRFHMNFDYLNSLFRQSVGRPIFQYLCSLRIARAKELLTTTSMRISQISEQVGFTDESYFSKVFKKYTGSCPADYAKVSFNNREPSLSTYGSASGSNN